MKRNTLKTKRDYQAALTHVERLMDQPLPDVAELESWSLLVANYEELHFPIATAKPLRAVDSLAGSLGKGRASISIKKMKMGTKSAIARAGRKGLGTSNTKVDWAANEAFKMHRSEKPLSAEESQKLSHDAQGSGF